MQEVRIFDPREHVNFYPDSIDTLRQLKMHSISDVHSIRNGQPIHVEGDTLDALVKALSGRPPLKAKGDLPMPDWVRFKAIISPPFNVATDSVAVALWPGSESPGEPSQQISISGMYNDMEAARTGLGLFPLGHVYPEASFRAPAVFIYGFGRELDKAWKAASGIDFHSAVTKEGKPDYMKLLALEKRLRHTHGKIAEIVFPPLASLGLVPEFTEDVGEAIQLESFDEIARYWVLSTHYDLRLPQVHVALNGNDHNGGAGSGFVVEANYRDSAFRDVLTGGVLRVTSEHKDPKDASAALVHLLEVCNSTFAKQP